MHAAGTRTERTHPHSHTMRNYSLFVGVDLGDAAAAAVAARSASSSIND